MKVALCVIATGKYTRFLPQLLESATEFFCCGHEVRYQVLSNHEPGDADGVDLTAETARRVLWYHVDHEPWPGPTLHRYRMMLTAEPSLCKHDYLYYIDADMFFAAPVGDEVFGRLTATIHPGFANQPKRKWTFEKRRKSQAFVPWTDATHYYCGGFQGGSQYLEAMAVMDAMIRCDEQRGIIPVWHDESVWNAYLVKHPPDTILSPLYCSPDRWKLAGRRIVAIDKNHAEVRS